MGKRDYRWREKKKPKKDAKKINATVLPPAVEVEVIKKVRRREDEEEI